MSLSAAEKLEVIRMVEESELPMKRTLAELARISHHSIE